MKSCLSCLLARAVVCFGFIYILLFSSVIYADIVITPTRVVFEDRDRFASVMLVNPGDKTSTYEMKWRFFKMQETGPAYRAVEESVTDFDLSKYIIFSPKRVSLAPGASQKIRLALRRPAEIPDGDYHVHLGFAPVPDKIENIAGADVDGATRPAVSVKINVGYTIPVILRSGKVDVSAFIERISLSRNRVNGLLRVAVPVRREGGPYSILGHLIIYHIDENGRQERVGEISNAHIFPEVDRRVFDVQLIKDIKGGALRVVMYDHQYNKNEVDNFIYTERTFPLE